MSQADIQTYKTRLLQLRAEYAQRVSAIAKDLHHEEHSIEKDFAEQATQLENNEVLTSLDDEARANIMEIDKALLRIEEGRFGICEACAEAISEPRLQALPYARLCIDCAENEHP